MQNPRLLDVVVDEDENAPVFEVKMIMNMKSLKWWL